MISSRPGLEVLRSATDFIHLLFVVDEYTDNMGRADTQKLADIVLDAIRNPMRPRPKDEHLLGEMARQ